MRRRIVQGCCLLSLLALAACQDNSGSSSSVSYTSDNSSATAPAQDRAARKTVQWGLLPLNALPRVDITATTHIASVRVMRQTKQNRLRPRKIMARLRSQKSTTRIKTASRLIRQAALQPANTAAPAGNDTILAMRPKVRSKPAAPAQRSAKQSIAPAKTVTKAKTVSRAKTVTRAKTAARAKPATSKTAPGAIASLPRRASDRLSTGSINLERSIAAPGPLKSYLSPGSGSSRYKLAILGDSLGVGIGLGMSRSFIRQGRLDVLKKSKESSGLARPDFYNWDKALSRVVRSHKIDIAIVEIGANDGQSIRSAGKLRRFGTPAWRREYIKRIDKFIARLKREHASVYWVEIPPMGRPKLNSQVKLINAVIKGRVQRHDIKYISTWKRFSNRYGQYTAYSRDSKGRRVKTRARDGVHFTMKGYRLLAAHVEKTIRQDLKIAQQARMAKLAQAGNVAVR